MTPLDLSEVDDLELTSRAREGDEGAVVELWKRHFPAALSTARRVARQPRDAEELAADAFSGMLAALSTGGGPTGSVRAYLLTSVRNGVTTRARRANASDILTDENAVLENAADVPFDPVATAGELSLMREAFATLPERWRHVLWRTAVDHDSNILVAEELGVSPNAVAALARRARQGLRAAYVQVHVSRGAVEPGCLPFIGGLAALLPDAGGNSDTAEHVRGCERCTERLAELRRVDRNLSGFLTPAVLTLAPGGLAGAAVAGGSGGGSAAAGTSASSSASTWVSLATAAVVGAGVLTWVLWPKPAAAPVPAVTTTASVGPPTTAAPVKPRATTRPPAATTTRPPRVTPTTRQPKVVPPPAPVRTTTPAPPRTTPPPPPATTTQAPAGRLSAVLAMGGPTTAPFIQISASGQQLAGGLHLRLSVPVGVSLRGSSGAWQQCTQSGTTITCVASASSAQSWSGTVSTTWAQGSSGTVQATVAGTYQSGAPASATAATTWP
jgi:RNA polymerase sigma factor (sigma-70 family)